MFFIFDTFHDNHENTALATVFNASALVPHLTHVLHIVCGLRQVHRSLAYWRCNGSCVNTMFVNHPWPVLMVDVAFIEDYTAMPCVNALNMTFVARNPSAQYLLHPYLVRKIMHLIQILLLWWLLWRCMIYGFRIVTFTHNAFVQINIPFRFVRSFLINKTICTFCFISRYECGMSTNSQNSLAQIATTTPWPITAGQRRPQNIFVGLSFSGVGWSFVCGVRSLCRHIHVSKPAFWRSLLT